MSEDYNDATLTEFCKFWIDHRHPGHTAAQRDRLADRMCKLYYDYPTDWEALYQAAQWGPNT